MYRIRVKAIMPALAISESLGLAMRNKILAVFLFVLTVLPWEGASFAEDVVYVSYWTGGGYNVGYVDQWGQWTLIPNVPGSPPSISWSVDGHLYCDDGRYISQIGTNGAQTHVLTVPRGLDGYAQTLAATPDGRLYYFVILGSYSHAVYLATTSGNVYTVSTNFYAWSMAAGPDNNLYAITFGVRPNVSVLSPTGKVTTLISNLEEVVGNNFSGGIVLDKNGALYLDTQTSIFRIDQSGAASVYATGFNQAGTMTIDSRGNLYVVERQTQLSRVDTNGRVSVLTSNLPNVKVISFLTAGADPRGNYIAPPFVSSQPESQVGYWGKSVSFSASFGGATPMGFQWNKDGNPIASATNTTLVLNDLKVTDSGTYTLTATNIAGATTTKNATLTVNSAGVSLGLYPGVLIDGVVGRSYGVFYCTNLDNNIWLPLTNITLTTSPQLWLDASANTSDPAYPRRFYLVRAVGP
jgi:hypothetical protein